MRHHFVVGVNVEPLVQAAVQMICRADVKLPNVFRLPGREGIGIDGLDVGVSQQAQHLQPLGCLHFFSKGAHGFEIEDIASQCGAHFQMAPDEKQNRFAVWLVQIETLEDALGDIEAGSNMIARFRAFADIMQKQRQVKQFGLLEFLQKFGIALIPFRLGLAQRMKVVDSHKRVFINGETMRVVAYHQRIDCGEFRKQQREQAQRMHRAQRICRVGSDERVLKRVPQLGAFRQRSRK